MWKRRDFLKASAAIGTVAAAGRPLTALAQGAPEVSKLALGFGIDPPFAPHVVAMTKGWFREAGFTDVATKTFTSGAVAGEALVAGEIQLWTPGQLPPISMAHNGVPIAVIGTNCVNWDLEKLVVRKDANIDKPEDLYRIRIGLLQGSTSSAMLHFMAKRYGLDEKRLQVVNLPPPEQLASLTSNNVQGLLCWEPWPFRGVGTGQAKLLHSGMRSYFGADNGKEAKVSDNRSLYVVSQEFARRNPRATAALAAVMVRAQKYVASPANTDEVQKTFSDYQKQKVEDNKAIWGNYVFNPAFDDHYVGDMERTADFLEASGRIKKRVHVLDYTFTGPVAAADRSLVKVEGKWKG